MQLTMNHETKSFVEIARERVMTYGEQQSDMMDLLALIIGKKVDPSLCQLLSSMSVREILNASMEQLKELGFTKSIAERLYATILFAKKVNQMSLPDTARITSPVDAYQALKYLENTEQEKFVVLALDTKNQIIARKEIFCGSLNASLVHPREVYRFAIQKAAASIIVGHQHPSGDPQPSREDLEVTSRLREVGKTVGVDCLDHIIVGKNRFISLKEKGLM